MSNIYDQHRAAFSNVSAFAIMKGTDRVASVAIKFPRDGAGRLYAYVHFFGMPMVRGFAGGYGYDKRTAAVEDAMKKIDPAYFATKAGEAGEAGEANHWEAMREECEKFVAAVSDACDGTDWDTCLTAAGYDVHQAV